MSYSSVLEPLRAANQLAGRALYDILQIPASGVRAVSSTGAVIEATDQAGSRVDYDLVLLFAGGDPSRFRSEPVYAWLRLLDRRGVRLGGVSGGAVILANAGLMQNRRMTVHWEHAPYLMETHPDLMVERSLYVMDRDRITVAGGIAPLDMMHALITEHHGPDFARQVSDWYMHTDIRPSGGPQRAGIAEKYHINSPALIQAIEAMENHIADPLELDQLTGFSGTGPRQLNRLFREKLGISTMDILSRDPTGQGLRAAGAVLPLADRDCAVHRLCQFRPFLTRVPGPVWHQPVCLSCLPVNQQAQRVQGHKNGRAGIRQDRQPQTGDAQHAGHQKDSLQTQRDQDILPDIAHCRP